jgi:hypothetical protein
MRLGDITLIDNRSWRKNLIELKVITLLENVHLAQAINYLGAFELEVGFLINFGATSLQFRRFQNKYKVSHQRPSNSLNWDLGD